MGVTCKTPAVLRPPALKKACGPQDRPWLGCAEERSPSGSITAKVAPAHRPGLPGTPLHGGPLRPTTPGNLLPPRGLLPVRLRLLAVEKGHPVATGSLLKSWEHSPGVRRLGWESRVAAVPRHPPLSPGRYTKAQSWGFDVGRGKRSPKLASPIAQAFPRRALELRKSQQNLGTGSSADPRASAAQATLHWRRIRSRSWGAPGVLRVAGTSRG